MKLLITYLGISLLCFLKNVIAQEITHLNFTRFSSESGLTSSNISKVVQDNNGFIWVPSQDGLFRFDGTHFSSYNSFSVNAQKSLSGGVIRDMDIRDNTLWVVNALGGVDAINTNTGNIIFQYRDNLPENENKRLWLSIAIDLNSVFIGTNKGLCVLENGLLKQIDFQTENNSFYINRMRKDSNYLWIFCNGKGIGMVDVKTKKLVDLFKDSLTNYYDSEILHDGKILVATSSGLKMFTQENKKIIPIPLPSSYKIFTTKPVFSVRKDNDDHVYLSLRNQLIRLKLKNGDIEEIMENNKEAGKSWLNDSYGIYFDKNNLLWVSTQNGLLMTSTEKKPFQPFSKSSNSADEVSHPYYINAVNDSTLYSCAKDGLYSINLASHKIKALQKGISYFYIFETLDQKKIVSNENGTFVLNNNILQPLRATFPELKMLEEIVLNSHTQLSDSIIILGSQNYRGIFVWNTKSKTIYPINTTSYKLKLKDNIVNCLYNDSYGRIWILGDNSISIYENNAEKIQSFNIVNNTNGKTFGVYFDIREIKNNYYISSYDNGILVIDKQLRLVRQITTKNGLSNNCVYKLLPYRDSLLLATTNNGLSVINLQNGKIKTYYNCDGLHSNEFEEFSGNIYKNLLFAGGKGGLTLIKPALFTDNKVPPTLYFDKITIKSDYEEKDTLNTQLQKLSIAPHTLQTTISFTALNYSNPTRTTYAYQIKELHKEFLPLGNQNFINLIGLSPGTYTLQVKAANEDGVWCEPKTLTLIFEPKWYQTIWFKLLLVGVGVGISYGMYRYRLHQLKREELIRTRIAADLHDDIGSTLTSVRIFTDLGLSKNSTEYLPQIRQGVQEAATSLRDIIWVLDKTNNSASHLLDRVNRFALPLTNARQIAFEIQKPADAEHIMLAMEQRRDLYLIMKEFVTNSLKYSQCQKIWVTAKKDGKHLQLLLQDDGAGFDADTITRGNGLNNMVNRARQAGYSATLHSQPGKGTSLELVALQ